MKPATLLVFSLALGAVAPRGFAAALDVDGLRCEYRENPLGIDAEAPRLSWLLRGAGRHQRQTAFQVLVASTPDRLKAGQGDLWDTGKIFSDQSTQVGYAGAELESQTQCFWKVRVWDQDGKPSAWSPPARWSMGLLHPEDWNAKWIGLRGVEETNYLAGTDWIWFPEGHPEQAAPVGTNYFRRTFILPAARPIRKARLLIASDNRFNPRLNGHDIGGGSDWHSVRERDVTFRLNPGTNILAVTAENTGTEPNPAGLVALLEIHFSDGGRLVIPTDEQWKVSKQAETGWTETAFDDSQWVAALKLGPVGMQPWGDITASEDRRLPARWLRKEFAVEKKVHCATVYFSGLGLSELYLNGRKVGDHVLSPGLTEYPKRAFYVTFDVTSQLRQGANAMGVVLGNGRFYAPRSRTSSSTLSYGFPQLLLHLAVEYADGSTSEVVSDESWKLTADGPILANNEYDGEEYDARKEFPGWSQPGFEDSKWQPVQVLGGPGGAVVAQMTSPIRVVQDLKPVSLRELNPGVFIYDMGQNMVGWCQIKVSGPAGTRVSLRHAETLNPDGTLYLANLRSANVTDTYTLKGGGPEVWEPRFTYHGFRYVELTGFPGKPALSSLQGRVVHDDLPSAGEFVCSNPLLNRIYTNIVWGVAENYRSIPTDCPQRDERQGWLGDRSEEARGETYLFDDAAFYSKWLQDMADAQKPNGSISDVCPAYWPYFNDDVTWPSTSVILPAMLLGQYGDESIIARHYDSARKWMDHMLGFLTNGIISKDSYGDWCVPPESPTLIHSEDPNRRTDSPLLATAYFYHDLRLMERYAKQLGHDAEADRFAQLAEQVKTAFNARFLRRDSGQYDNGTQTSCVLPLAFGLVPDDQREAIFNHLVSKITGETKGHIGTGLIGGQFLNRVLSDNGRPDLAYSVATQRDYPGWGYMVGKGATTIWELWNGDTADPGMNSGNHVMLVGDLVIWLYEYLGGIQADPEQPGFKHIILKPCPVGDLSFVRATHLSPYGLIASDWHKKDGKFEWTVTVPVNTTATVFVPAQSGSDVLEGGKLAGRADGVQFLRADSGRVVFEVGRGTYHFSSSLPEVTAQGKALSSVATNVPPAQPGLLKSEFIYETAPFPECHASTIVETKQGLVAAWFGGTHERHPDVCIWVSRFVSGRWTPPVQVADGIQATPAPRMPCWNPVLFQPKSGPLLLFYKVGSSPGGWWGMMMSSTDCGQTWSKPRRLPEGILGPIKNKPVQLSNGDILCPSSTEGQGGWRVHFERTRDLGLNWTATAPVNDGKEISAIQPSILFHKDGRLQAIGRTRQSRIFEIWSDDDGLTWGKMSLTSLPNPNSGTDAVTLKDGRQLLVYNHNPNEKGRSPLNVAVADDGEHWQAGAVLEIDPGNQFSYPAVIQTRDGLVHITYTWKRLRIKHAVIDPSKLSLRPILNGEWPK